MAAATPLAKSLKLSFLFLRCGRRCYSATGPTTTTATTTKNTPLQILRPNRIARVETLRLEQLYRKDDSPQKVNLLPDVYRGADGKPHVFEAVRKAQQSLTSTDLLSQEPAPVFGNEVFIKAAAGLALGVAAPALRENRVLGIQTRTGAEALTLAAQFLKRTHNLSNCLLPHQSCAWLENIFRKVGMQCTRYQYYNACKGEVNINGLISDLLVAPEGSVVLLDACAHNPTGTDPTQEEWKLIAHVIKYKKMVPVFQLNMQGLASGKLDEDAWPLRYFVDSGIDLLCAQSFVNILGLHHDPVGNLLTVLSKPRQMDSMKSKFETLLHDRNYENSCTLGSHIVAKVIHTDSFFNDWCLALSDIHKKVQTSRNSLTVKLQELKTPGNWNYMKAQKGLYLYSNLKKRDIENLKKRHVYLPTSGRINLAGLNENNINYVAGAIHEVVNLRTDITQISPSSENYIHSLGSYLTEANLA